MNQAEDLRNFDTALNGGVTGAWKMWENKPHEQSAVKALAVKSKMAYHELLDIIPLLLRKFLNSFVRHTGMLT